MSEKNWLVELSPILKEYSIEPYFIESFGRILKIYSSKGVFALKTIDPHHGTDFIRYVQALYQKGYNRIVPIFPTADGRYAVLHDKNLYYLMPWLSNEIKEDRLERHKQLFRELARLHTLSAKEMNISKEDRKEHYENTQLVLDKDKEFLEGYIEECERTEYTSPFELLFCLYFQDISQALNFSEKKLKEWYDQTKDHEKVRTVIIHGKLSTEHFLFDDRGYGYFINFEESKVGSPIHDLLLFLSRSLKGYPMQNEESVELMSLYFKYFPFKEEEMLLFQSYFAHPGVLIKYLNRYHQTGRKKNERKHVQQLQRQFWQFKNIEYVVMRIDEIEKQKQQAAQAQAAQQEGAQSE
ncbi:spore coat protein YsxE [Bacillus sp. 03113]|uniref:spore coat protein YsxE n=1 Tax=Bacillus sp. 03113 TaxID=2578211 RepID=UPI0011430D21|nr:spore coat protein YsxE [Bacillus sp. 03113]